MAKKKATKKTPTKAAAKKTTTKKSTTKKTPAKKKVTKKKVAADSTEEQDGTTTKATKKKATKKRTRAKAAADARFKMYWGVFNHAMKRVALYDFNQRKAAEKRAQELTDSGKPPHFVMKIKEQIEEK